MAAILSVRGAVPAFIPACLLLVFCLSCQLCHVGSVDPVLAPQVITSANKAHEADNASDIKWGNIPKGNLSNDLSNEEHSDGLEPLFKFSRSFIYSALNGELPSDLIKRITNGGEINIIEDLKKIILDYVGFVVAIAVGIIFIVIFPIVGFCFCLCRLCGKCGGKMMQKPSSSPTKRKILSFLLFFGVVFSASGTAFMFASDVRLMDAIKRTPESLPKVMTAVAKFGDNTYKQIDFIGTETVDFLLKVIIRDLDNLDVLVGIPLREKLDKEANIKALFNTVRKLDQDLKNLKTSMQNTDTEIADVKTKSTDLINKMKTISTSINADHNACKAANACPTATMSTGVLTIPFDPTKLPDLKSEIGQISSIDLKAKIAKPETDFDEIPDLVKRKASSKVQDVKTKLTEVQTTTIPKYLKDAKKFKTDLDAGMVAGTDLGVLTNKSSDILDMVKPYNQIRSYVFIGLASFCLFIVGFLFIGLVLGCCGNDDVVNPVNRNCPSNCGGCMLMGAAAFIFLAGSLLMLLTTAMFIPGSVIEVYGCKSLREIGQGSVDNVLHAVLKENLGKVMFNNGNIDVKISEIYKWGGEMMLVQYSDLGALLECHNGQGVFKAAYLDQVVNLSTIYDYAENHGVKKDITNIKVDLSTIQILTPSIQLELKNSKKSLAINFAQFYTELGKTKSPSTLDTLVTDLENLKNAPNGYGTKFQKHADDIKALKKPDMEGLRTAKDTLKTMLQTMEIRTTSTTNTINKLTTDMGTTQGSINNNGNRIVKEVLTGFANRIFRVWEDFVDYIKISLNHDLGKCRPLTDIYDYLVIDTMCGMVDSFNAYWFGLGWCLFFLLFNLIVAVKLAKYFRRMKYSDELDGAKDDFKPGGNGVSRKRTGNFPPQNKVGQMPRY